MRNSNLNIDSARYLDREISGAKTEGPDNYEEVLKNLSNKYYKNQLKDIGRETEYTPISNIGVGIPPFSEKRIPSLVAIQEWEGYVTGIGTETFTARLLDLTAGDKTEKEEIEFLISDIREDDFELLKEGAVFRWSIGYLVSGGSKQRTSHIVFRRLPKWSKKDLEKIEQESKEIALKIKWI